MTALGLLGLSYLVGSVPASYLAGRVAGVDLRQRGSGNLGATNVFRVVGPAAAAPVLVADALKGFFPVWYFPLWDGQATPGLALAYGLAAVAGHVWPVFLRFRGGKGVATSAGVLLGVAPLATTVAVVLWTGLALLTRTVSVASLTAATATPLLAAAFDASWGTVSFAAFVAALVWWTHRANVRRIRDGREHRFGSEEARWADGVGTELNDGEGGS